MKTTHRRICWPEPGLVCLEGGCIYCNECPFRSLATIEAYLSTDEQWDSYRWGKEHDFCNAQTRTEKW